MNLCFGVNNKTNMASVMNTGVSLGKPSIEGFMISDAGFVGGAQKQSLVAVKPKRYSLQVKISFATFLTFSVSMFHLTSSLRMKD